MSIKYFPDGCADGDRFVAIFDRLDQIVARETDALRDGATTDLQEFVAEKSRGLLELSRLMNGPSPVAISDAGIERARRLVASLEVNRMTLETKRTALQMVSSILSRAYEEAYEDGLYGLRRSRSADV